MPRRSDTVDVPSLGDQAAENLQFIRNAMERSATFSAVPGVGGAFMGIVGLAAATLASQQQSRERWLMVWLGAALAAVVIGAVAIQRKAERSGPPLAGASARRFALSLTAPLVAGAILTLGLWMHGIWVLMPATWLLLYGTGLLTGGAFSVAPIQPLGALFMGCGALALFTPAAWGDAWLGFAFGALHVIFGIHIARKHGG
jgi:hypothetical protein